MENSLLTDKHYETFPKWILIASSWMAKTCKAGQASNGRYLDDTFFMFMDVEKK